MEKQETKAITIDVVVEKHDDGYVGYPLGLSGVVAGQGDTMEDAIEDTLSAVAIHIETFGSEALGDTTLEKAYVCSRTIEVPCPSSPEMSLKPVS